MFESNFFIIIAMIFSFASAIADFALLAATMLFSVAIHIANLALLVATMLYSVAIRIANLALLAAAYMIPMIYRGIVGGLLAVFYFLKYVCGIATKFERIIDKIIARLKPIWKRDEDYSEPRFVCSCGCGCEVGCFHVLKYRAHFAALAQEELKNRRYESHTTTYGSSPQRNPWFRTGPFGAAPARMPSPTRSFTPKQVMQSQPSLVPATPSSVSSDGSNSFSYSSSPMNAPEPIRLQNKFDQPTASSPEPKKQVPTAPKYQKGQSVFCLCRKGDSTVWEEATVTSVHLDNALVPYYTVQILADGREKQTEEDRILMR